MDLQVPKMRNIQMNLGNEGEENLEIATWFLFSFACFPFHQAKYVNMSKGLIFI